LVKTEADGSSTYYVHGLGLIGQEQDGEYLTYHFDLRGSTVALTDETGNLVQRFQYSPYGMLLGGDASKTPFLFNGQYGVMTDNNGLYYMRARYYSPDILRVARDWELTLMIYSQEIWVEKELFSIQRLIPYRKTFLYMAPLLS